MERISAVVAKGDITIVNGIERIRPASPHKKEPVVIYFRAWRGQRCAIIPQEHPLEMASRQYLDDVVIPPRVG